jgi:hypothetical protein
MYYLGPKNNWFHQQCYMKRTTDIKSTCIRITSEQSFTVEFDSPKGAIVVNQKRDSLADISHSIDTTQETTCTPELADAKLKENQAKSNKAKKGSQCSTYSCRIVRGLNRGVRRIFDTSSSVWICVRKESSCPCVEANNATKFDEFTALGCQD